VGGREGIPAGAWLVAARRNWQALAGMAALVVGLALALVAVAGFTQTRSQPALPPPPGIVAYGDVAPRILLFGDPLTARVVIVIDRRRIDPDGIRLQTPFPPFVPVSERSSRRDQGELTELRYTVTLQCLAVGCLPPIARKRYFAFPPTQVIYRERGGGSATLLLIRFPAVGVASRLSAEAVRAARRRTGALRAVEGPAAGISLQDAAQLVRDTARRLPPASYSISPTLLVTFLLVLALFLALAAIFVVARYVRPSPPPTKPKPVMPAMPPLEHALAELDLALANGQVDRQRKALELLARELVQSGEDGLAGEARELAWGDGSLARDHARALARTVRLSMNGKADGDAE
jgi:hypothetical protein